MPLAVAHCRRGQYRKSLYSFRNLGNVCWDWDAEHFTFAWFASPPHRAFPPLSPPQGAVKLTDFRNPPHIMPLSAADENACTWLRLAFHSITCHSTPDRPCLLGERCKENKQLLTHIIIQCNGSSSCPYPGCAAVRSLLRHYNACKVGLSQHHLDSCVAGLVVQESALCGEIGAELTGSQSPLQSCQDMYFCMCRRTSRYIIVAFSILCAGQLPRLQHSCNGDEWGLACKDAGAGTGGKVF